MTGSSGTTKLKQKGFAEYVKSTKNPSYSDYISFCKSKRYAVYGRDAFKHNLDKAGLGTEQEKTDYAGDKDIQTINLPSESPTTSIFAPSQNNNFDIITETAPVSDEAKNIASKYSGTGAPINSESSTLPSEDNTGLTDGQSQQKPNEQLDPEVFGYIPMAGVNLVIKKFIDPENSITVDEAQQIKTHSIKLIEKYAGEIAGEYATEVNFAFAMTNPVLRAALEKAEKEKIKVDNVIDSINEHEN